MPVHVKKLQQNISLEMENTMALGRRITELRQKHKQSLQDVASAVDVSKAHIWELEKGRAEHPLQFWGRVTGFGVFANEHAN